MATITGVRSEDAGQGTWSAFWEAVTENDEGSAIGVPADTSIMIVQTVGDFTTAGAITLEASLDGGDTFGPVQDINGDNVVMTGSTVFVVVGPHVLIRPRATAGTSVVMDVYVFGVRGNRSTVTVENQRVSADDVQLATKAIADLTGYDSAAIFTVTGNVRGYIIGVVGTAITSTSGTTTLAVGTAESTAGIIAASTVNNTQFAATDVWLDSTPANDVEASIGAPFVVAGTDILLTRNVDDLTAGSITFYCLWSALSADGNIVAA